MTASQFIFDPFFDIWFQFHESIFLSFFFGI